MNKYMLTLALGFALIAPVAQAADAKAEIQSAIQSINIDQLKSQISELVNKVFPVAQNIAMDIVNGNFDALQNYLNANSDRIDVNAVIGGIESTSNQIKKAIQNALPQLENYLSAVPAQYQAAATEALNQAKAHINDIDEVNRQLEIVRGKVNLRSDIGYAVNALKSAAANPQYTNVYQGQLRSFYNSTLVPAMQAIEAANLGKIEAGLEEGIKKAQGKDFDLVVLLNGIREGRSLATNLAGFVQNASQFASQVNDALNQTNAVSHLPSQIQEALNYISQHAGQVKDVFNNLGNTIRSYIQ